MIQQTRAIVLRTVKYGETSVICTLFTEVFGVQAYLVQGVRSSKSRGNKAGILQPTSLLDIIAYQKPNTNLQRLKEFHPSFIYNTVREDVVKNSIALFSVELLLRLLPEHAIMDDLFHFAYNYFCTLDKTPTNKAANFPCFFAIHCSRVLGYEVSGSYNEHTPYLNMHEGSFSAIPSQQASTLSDAEVLLLDKLLKCYTLEEVGSISMNAEQRFKILDWYIEYLQQHTQHMGNIRSLSVLRVLLH